MKLLPPATEVWGKVIFLHLSVILFTGGVVSQHALQVVSQHALQVSRLTPKGEVEGSGLGGSPGPHLGGLQTHTWGGLQAHTWGISRPTPGGVSRPTPRGVVSQHALRQRPPQPTAIAAGGSHPSGMHSCLKSKCSTQT